MFGRKSSTVDEGWIHEQRDVLRRDGTVQLRSPRIRETFLLLVMGVCAVGYAMPLIQGDPRPLGLSRPVAGAWAVFLSLTTVFLLRAFIRLGRVAVVVDTEGVHITKGASMPWLDILGVEVIPGDWSRRNDVVQVRMSNGWTADRRERWVRRGRSWRSWLAQSARQLDQGQARIQLPLLRQSSRAITQWLLSEAYERRDHGTRLAEPEA